jgi:hypothetical protein
MAVNGDGQKDHEGRGAVTRSARSLLVAWANQQDAWMRALTGEIFPFASTAHGGARR